MEPTGEGTARVLEQECDWTEALVVVCLEVEETGPRFAERLLETSRFSLRISVAGTDFV